MVLLIISGKNFTKKFQAKGSISNWTEIRETLLDFGLAHFITAVKNVYWDRSDSWEDSIIAPAQTLNTAKIWVHPTRNIFCSLGGAIAFKR